MAGQDTSISPPVSPMSKTPSTKRVDDKRIWVHEDLQRTPPSPSDSIGDIPLQANWEPVEETVLSEDLRSLSGATLQVDGEVQRLDEVGIAVAYPEPTYKSPSPKRQQRSALHNLAWRDPWPLRNQAANSPNRESVNRSDIANDALRFSPIAVKPPCRACNPLEALPNHGFDIPGVPSGPDFENVRPHNIFNSPETSRSASQHQLQTVRDPFSDLSSDLEGREPNVIPIEGILSDMEAYKNTRRSFPRSLTFDPVLERQRELEERDAAEGYGQKVLVGKYKYMWFTVMFVFIAMFLCLFLYSFGILK